MRRLWTSILFLCVALSSSTVFADKIFLKNGKEYSGKIIQESDSSLIFGASFDSSSEVRLTFLKNEIAKIQKDDGAVIAVTPKIAPETVLSGGGSPKIPPSSAKSSPYAQDTLAQDASAQDGRYVKPMEHEKVFADDSIPADKQLYAGLTFNGPELDYLYLTSEIERENEARAIETNKMIQNLKPNERDKFVSYQATLLGDFQDWYRQLEKLSVPPVFRDYQGARLKSLKQTIVATRHLISGDTARAQSAVQYGAYLQEKANQEYDKVLEKRRKK